MSVALPITRSSRSIDLAAAVGQVAFTLPGVPIWRVEDVAVFRRVAPSTTFNRLTSGFTAALGPGGIGATVTFAMAPRTSAGDPVTTIRVRSARVDERIDDVTRAGKIASAPLERRFDILATINQEMRRDLDEIDPGLLASAAAAAQAIGSPPTDFSTEITPPQITADVNDYAPTGGATATVWRLSSDANRVIGGMTPATTSGQLRFLVNIGQAFLVLADQSATSSDAWRFSLGAALVIAPGAFVIARYDGTLARWQVSQPWRLGTDPATPAQIVATTHNYAPAGSAAAASVWRLSSDAARDITGVAAGYSGQLRLLINVGAFPIALLNENVGSLPGNRFALAAGVTLVANGGSALIWYDATAQRWRALSDASAAGGGLSSFIRYDQLVTLAGPDLKRAGDNLLLSDLLGWNGVINGTFDFWQRGTSFTANGYTADRWRMDFSGGSFTVSRQAFGLSTVLGSGTIKPFFLQAVVSGQSAAGDFARISHRIEGVRRYAGQTVTFQLMIPRLAGSGNAAVEFVQNFGTGGSPSAQVTGIGSQIITLGTAWGATSRIAVTVSIPAIGSATLGSNGDDYLEIVVWLSAGSTFAARAASLGTQAITVGLQQAGINRGSTALEYLERPIALEETLCRRYFTRTFANTRFNAPSAGSQFETAIYFTTPMRTTPTVSNITAGGRANIGAGTTITAISAMGARHAVQSSASGDTYALGDTADFSAEL